MGFSLFSDKPKYQELDPLDSTDIDRDPEHQMLSGDKSSNWQGRKIWMSTLVFHKPQPAVSLGSKII